MGVYSKKIAIGVKIISPSEIILKLERKISVNKLGILFMFFGSKSSVAPSGWISSFIAVTIAKIFIFLLLSVNKAICPWLSLKHSLLHSDKELSDLMKILPPSILSATFETLLIRLYPFFCFFITIYC